MKFSYKYVWYRIRRSILLRWKKLEEKLLRGLQILVKRKTAKMVKHETESRELTINKQYLTIINKN